MRRRQRAGRDRVSRQVRALAEREADRRVRIWMQVCLAGQRPVDVAREHGCADGSGVVRVVQRLDAAAAKDRHLRKRLAAAREMIDVSGVKS